MKRLTCMLAVFSVLLGSVTLNGAAQTFDLELSMSLVFGPDGVSESDSVFEGSASTSISGVNASLSTVWNISGLQEGQLVLGSALGGATVRSVTTFSMAGFEQEQFTVSGSFEGIGWSSTTVFTAAGFANEIIGLSVQQDNLTLNGSSVFGPGGFASQSVYACAQLEQGSVGRLTSFDPSGITRETWKLALTAGASALPFCRLPATFPWDAWIMDQPMAGITLLREAVYTPDGLAQDKVVGYTTVQEVNLRSTTTFTPDGFATELLSLSGEYLEVDFRGDTLLNAEGFVSQDLSRSRARWPTISALALTLNPEGLQRGALTFDWTIEGLSLGEEPEEDEGEPEA